jgi:arginyl-tRNA synthetase
MLHALLEQRLQAAVVAVLPDAPGQKVLVRPCADPQFGDYQSNLTGLAKERKINPRQFAEQVKARLDAAEWCESVEIAGAGFLNFRLKTAVLERTLTEAVQGKHLFFEKAAQPKTVVVDFSSPNVAKPMHVGHIRSTILGDSLARTLRLLGHKVVTDNHIGDWGTQFGKLLVGWKTQLNREALAAAPIAEMERLYKAVNVASERAPAVLEASRQELVKLQNGDVENLTIWKEMLALSQAEFATIYRRLGVKFDYALGESFYNPRLKAVVQDLRDQGVASESEGAICVFSDGKVSPKEDPFLVQRDGAWQPNPCLIQKSDGASNYATTDLATLAHRMETWQPREILYVTDGRQQLHFRQVFAAFRRWQPEAASRVKLVHVWFGSILGDDGKPFKTRAGETVKLADLLDEAQERALAVVTQKNPDLPEADRQEIARVVGIGAVKYADLLPNRQSDYVFSWDKMLSLQGNSAVYLMYAYARIRSIHRKSEESGLANDRPAPVQLAAPEELALARHLLNFGLVLQGVTEEHRPNFLCNYLYELAGLFARFYENCPVLKSEGAQRQSRLALCRLAAKVIQQGLEALGIEVLEQM